MLVLIDSVLLCQPLPSPYRHDLSPQHATALPVAGGLAIGKRERAQVIVGMNILLSIPNDHRQVQHQRNPISIDEEQEREERVDGGFRDDVSVEAIAQIDGVDVVAVAYQLIALKCGNKRWRLFLADLVMMGMYAVMERACDLSTGRYVEGRQCVHRATMELLV